MNKDQIRKALNHFENNEYTVAKGILTKEIQCAKREYLIKKLHLKVKEKK